MSDERHTTARERCGGDAAGYALGALEPVEAEAFERHLAECERCAEDLAEFGHVVDALAISPPQYRAPSELRRRVMTSVRGEPRRSRASRRRWRWAPVAVGLASAVLVVATLVSGGSGKARVLDARVFDSPGSAQVRLSGGRAELIVRHFPAPAAGDVYEVWLKRAGRALEPTGALFSVGARGADDVGVPGALQGVQEILVTEEPAGGSLVPTSSPVIVGRLS